MSNRNDWRDQMKATARSKAEGAPAPGDPRLQHQLAADCLATQLSRGFPPAIELSDLFAAAGVRLPLLNWPAAALRPLEVAP